MDPVRTKLNTANDALRSRKMIPDETGLLEKKRARRRLLGAVVLVLAVIIILPMILDSEPKPLAEDIAIQIPSRDQERIKASLEPQEQEVDVRGNVVVQSAPQQKLNQSVLSSEASQNKFRSLSPSEQVAQPEAGTTAQPERTSEAAQPERLKSSPTSPNVSAPAAEAEASLPVRPAPSSAALKEPAKPKLVPPSLPPVVEEKKGEDARARAILEGRTGEDEGKRFTIQVAALTSHDKVRELQAKLQESGITSYTQKIPTQSGERIRVRVGPFNSKKEAEQMHAKLMKLGLSVSMIPG